MSGDGYMSRVNRRGLIIGTGAVYAAAIVASQGTGKAQLVYRRGDWKADEFQQLLQVTAHVRQVFDVTAINEGKFLNNIKNSLNGLEFGFDIPHIQIVAALHGAANFVNYDDSIWTKYRIGEWLGVTDPATGQPAVRNIFFPSKLGPAAERKEDPSDEKSSYQDRSVQGLQRRGVKFMSCHTATEEQARVLVKRLQLSTTTEDFVKDMQEHTVPGVLIVPSMVAAVAMLQIEGHYSYITV
jgi:intracellular sulfur oxidation DsrE/DsrF family protein